VKKITILLFLTSFLTVATLPTASAMEGWEASIKVTSGQAASTLAFGQRPDATDLADGLYDLPAMLSGDIQVYFSNEEGSFWRDIRGPGSHQEWRLVMVSQTGEPVTVSWNPSDLPGNKNLTLRDVTEGIEIDMKAAEYYIHENIFESSLLIEVKDNR